MTSKKDTMPLDNQSVSSLNISQLVGNPGSKMLQYIRSNEFGKHGEPQKLYEIILEFISKLNDENENLHVENE